MPNINFTQESSDTNNQVSIDQNQEQHQATVPVIAVHGDPALDALLAGEAFPEIEFGASNTYFELFYRVPYSEQDHRGMLAAMALQTLPEPRQNFYRRVLNRRQNRAALTFLTASFRYISDRQVAGVTTGVGIAIREDLINVIPLVTLNDETLQAGEQFRTCSVCMESFASGESVRQLGCGHRFHSACLQPWLELSRTCPACSTVTHIDNLVDVVPHYRNNTELAINALLAGEAFPGTRNGEGSRVVVSIRRSFQFSEPDHRGLLAAISLRALSPSRQRAYMQAFLLNPNPIPRNSLMASMRFLRSIWQEAPDDFTGIRIAALGGGPQPTGGMRREEIDAITKATINGDDSEGKRTCSVCIEDFVVGEKVFQLSCNHLYHQPCLRPWLLLNRTCPLCRKSH